MGQSGLARQPPAKAKGLWQLANQARPFAGLAREPRLRGMRPSHGKSSQPLYSPASMARLPSPFEFCKVLTYIHNIHSPPAWRGASDLFAPRYPIRPSERACDEDQSTKCSPAHAPSPLPFFPAPSSSKCAPAARPFITRQGLASALPELVTWPPLYRQAQSIQRRGPLHMALVLDTWPATQRTVRRPLDPPWSHARLSFSLVLLLLLRHRAGPAPEQSTRPEYADVRPAIHAHTMGV